MVGEQSNICPVCGNVRQNGICRRCRADDIRRSQGMQKWDRGGARPERRINYEENSPPSGTHELIKTPPISDNSLYLALDGEWYSERKNIRIHINLAHRMWKFTLSSGRTITQYWNPTYKSATSVLLTQKGKEIKANVGIDGGLMLTGRRAPVHFVNIKAGKKYRLCRKCLNKTAWQYENCHHCDWVFK